MSRSKRIVPDEKSRQRIVDDLDTTFLVEAGAGSGKTTKLVDRISALLASGRAEAAHIAAVTFTRKAAAGLRERLQWFLERRAASDPDPVIRDRMRAAVSDIGLAFIGTIHSFCARLLRERPVESGLDPEFTELDEAEGSRFLETCWQDFLLDAFVRGDRALNRLAEIGTEPMELHDLFLRLCQFRDVEPCVPARPKPDLKPARTALHRFIAELGKAMPSSQPDGGWDKLQTAYRSARFLLDHLDRGKDSDLIEVLAAFEKCTVVLNRWPDKKTAKRLKDELLPDFLRETVEPSVRGWREHIYPDCISFARAAAEFAALRRAAASTLDYTDLLMKARDLLRDHGDVRAFFASRFTHVLVDEFQDTDPIQCEIIFYLCGEPRHRNAGWREFHLRPGALFVVGDPKQSIYRFRRADISAYGVVRNLIEQSGGEVLNLSANFRSVHSIGSFVDRTFTNIFPEEATDRQAAFAPLATQKPDAAPLSGVRKLAVEGVTRKEEIFGQSSALVASWVTWALAGNVQVGEGGRVRPAAPGDILILTWQRDPLIGIAAALEHRHVPFDIAGTRGAFDAPEVGDMMRLLASLADPDNPVALVGVLISPLFGHSYQALWDYKKEGGTFRFLGAAHLEGAPAQHPVAASLKKIEAWWRLTLDRAPAAAIGSILEQTGLVPLAASSPLGATMAGRLLQLVEMTRRAAELGRADFPSAVEWLTAAIETDVEPLSILAGRADLVRVMNLHRAKGLEAPIVILAVPYRVAPRAPESHVDRFAGKEPTAWFQVTRQFGEWGTKVVAQPPGWDAKQQIEQEYQQAEEDRLRYVASTRACQLLVIADAAGKNPWAPLLGGNIGELRMESIDLSGRARPRLKLTATACVQEIQAVVQAMSTLAAPGYAQSAVTEFAKPAGVALPSERPGRGPEYGSVIHRCLEWLANGRQPSQADIEAMCAEFDLAPAPIADIETELRRVRESDLWRRAMSAAERQTEVPFSMMQDGVLLSGIIDLAFRENGRWCLVDYKTDRIPATPDAHIKFYTPQLRCYEKAWQQLSGGSPPELILFFTHPCTAHRIQKGPSAAD
jgi:ATP-dependent helicase/nuclease subunit A